MCRRKKQIWYYVSGRSIFLTRYRSDIRFSACLPTWAAKVSLGLMSQRKDGHVHHMYVVNLYKVWASPQEMWSVCYFPLEHHCYIVILFLTTTYISRCNGMTHISKYRKGSRNYCYLIVLENSPWSNACCSRGCCCYIGGAPPYEYLTCVCWLYHVYLHLRTQFGK